MSATLTLEEARSRIIHPLDMRDAEKMAKTIERLSPLVGGFKVGLEAMFSIGPAEAAAMVNDSGKRLMFDAKLFDIPNTLKGAMGGIVENYQPWLVTMHAQATRRGVEAVVGAAGDTLVCCVTVLTTTDPDTAEYKLLYPSEIDKQVADMMGIADTGGAHALVCAPRELGAVVNLRPDAGFIFITPGVRPTWAAANDQVRVMTPEEAAFAGADFQVIGRPISEPPEAAPGIDGSSEAAAEDIAISILHGLERRAALSA